MIQLTTLQRKVLSDLLENIIDNTQASFKKDKFNSIATMEFDEFDFRAMGHIKNKLMDPDKLDYQNIQKIIVFYGRKGIIININAYYSNDLLAYSYFDVKGPTKDKKGIAPIIIDMILRANSRFNTIEFTDEYQIFESKT